MRQQDKVIVWPVYFDSTKTRKSGRRIPKNLAVPSPNILEIKEAAKKLGIDCDFVADLAHSKTPWLKTGMLLMKKSKSKEETLRNIARQICRSRSSEATVMK